MVAYFSPRRAKKEMRSMPEASIQQRKRLIENINK
jgi:hypothetical protein